MNTQSQNSEREKVEVTSDNTLKIGDKEYKKGNVLYYKNKAYTLSKVSSEGVSIIAVDRSGNQEAKNHTIKVGLENLKYVSSSKVGFGDEVGEVLSESGKQGLLLSNLQQPITVDLTKYTKEYPIKVIGHFYSAEIFFENGKLQFNSQQMQTIGYGSGEIHAILIYSPEEFEGEVNLLGYSQKDIWSPKIHPITLEQLLKDFKRWGLDFDQNKNTITFSPNETFKDLYFYI